LICRIGSGGLVWRSLVRPSLNRSIGALTRTGGALSPAAEPLFLDTIEEGDPTYVKMRRDHRIVSIAEIVAVAVGVNTAAAKCSA
jgi:hypothetical protein